MAGAIKLSEDFKLSVPDEIRRETNWQVGQEFVFVPKGRGYVIVPVPRRDDLAGVARGADPSDFRDRGERF